MKLNLSENFATYVAMMLGDWLLTVSPPQGCTNGVTWFRRVNGKMPELGILSVKGRRSGNGSR